MGMGQRNTDAIPLCPEHHRGKEGFHHRPKTWQKKYGTETELLGQVRELLKNGSHP